MTTQPNQPTQLAHQWKECDCGRSNCAICEWGASICRVCGCTEGELPTHCPGRKVEYDLRQAIMSGKADCFNGVWLDRSVSKGGNGPIFDVETGTLVFGGYTCRLEVNHTVTGHIRIDLIDVKDGQFVITASKADPCYPPLLETVLIKDYSENEGMLETLVNANVVRDTGEMSGLLHICRLIAALPENKGKPSSIL